MNAEELKRFISGSDEVELTDELIKDIVQRKKWGDEESLKEWRERGAMWNIKRDSLVLPL